MSLNLTEPPFFRVHVFCCTNQRPESHERGSCAAKNGVKLRNYMKIRAKELGLKDIRVNTAGCLDRCEQGPVIVVYPQGIWYKAETFADIDEILVRHFVRGIPVEHLRIQPENPQAGT